MPNRMRRAIDKLAINGENPTWVGSKKVLGNDSKVRLGRLVLPGESKLDELLRAEEKGRSVYTKMVDGDGEVWELDFNYWPSLKRFGASEANITSSVLESMLSTLLTESDRCGFDGDGDGAIARIVAAPREDWFATAAPEDRLKIGAAAAPPEDHLKIGAAASVIHCMFLFDFLH
ncbi:hypothetical protein Syun_019631 [Stephania yunnanensis]|uniref:Uncharacterized protein n=1 Tax=Stephania yunnanensis TaxID=152371 RepID=A0AAP0IUK7_9MAGN